MAGMAAGENYTPLRPGWRQNSDLDIINPETQASLAGGWYTGPGLSKFTYPQVRLAVNLTPCNCVRLTEQRCVLEEVLAVC